MKKNKIIVVILLGLIVNCGYLSKIVAQNKVVMVPHYILSPPYPSRPNWAVEFSPDDKAKVNNTNFLENSFQVVTEFNGNKLTSTYNHLLNWEIGINRPLIWSTDSPAQRSAFGKFTLFSKLGNTTPAEINAEFRAANEAGLVANRKAGESFTTLISPNFDAVFKLNMANVITTSNAGVKCLLIGSSKNQVLAGNSGSAVLNPSGSAFKYRGVNPQLPSGYKVVSNAISVVASNAAFNITNLDHGSELTINYSDRSLSREDEQNMALLFWYRPGQSWMKSRFPGEQAVLDTLNNKFIVSNFTQTGTYILAAMDDTHSSYVLAKPLTASRRSAGKKLILSGTVDSTAVLYASAGQEIILRDGFTARPGSTLIFGITGNYKSNPSPISTLSSQQPSSERMEAESESGDDALGLSVFPNPTNGDFKVKYNLSSAQNVRLSIKNITGLEMKILVNGSREAGIYEDNYNISDLNSGLFLLVLESDMQPMKVIKIIKQ